MALFRSGNPALGAKTFEVADKSDQVMTLQGTVNKTFILFGLILLGAIMPWKWAMALPYAKSLEEFAALESMVYTAVIAWKLPDFLIHPYAPIIKNLPVLAALWLLHRSERRAWNT